MGGRGRVGQGGFGACARGVRWEEHARLKYADVAEDNGGWKGDGAQHKACPGRKRTLSAGKARGLWLRGRSDHALRGFAEPLEGGDQLLARVIFHEKLDARELLSAGLAGFAMAEHVGRSGADGRRGGAPSRGGDGECGHQGKAWQATPLALRGMTREIFRQPPDECANERAFRRGEFSVGGKGTPFGNTVTVFLCW